MMKWKNLTKTKHRPDDSNDESVSSDDVRITRWYNLSC